jgi:phosphoglycolate phosphatase
MLKMIRPIPTESLRLLVFDLDGTLIDSGDDLCASVNAMLHHFGRPPLPQAVISTYIGDGAAKLVSRSLGEPSDATFLDQAITFFLDYYREHKLDHTYVYAGVFPSLDNLLEQAPDRSMAVLTNKPIGPSVAICEGLGLSRYFFQIYGGNSFVTKKPDPEGLLALMEEAGARPEETLMIGDSHVDILTAKNAGAWSMGCTYGLSPQTLAAVPADCLVESPSDWPEVFAPSTNGIQEVQR